MYEYEVEILLPLPSGQRNADSMGAPPNFELEDKAGALAVNNELDAEREQVRKPDAANRSQLTGIADD